MTMNHIKNFERHGVLSVETHSTVAVEGEIEENRVNTRSNGL